MRWLALLAAALLSACGGNGPTAQASATVRVAALGDSITLRTGQCIGECTQEVRDASYATHLPAATDGAVSVVLNAGRGGDTCTPQAPYIGGLHDGQPRGLEARLHEVTAARPDVVLLLAGGNDVAGFGVAPEQALACVLGVRARLQASGAAVLLLTYPPINAGPQWAPVARLNALLLQAGAVPADTWPQWAVPYYTTDGLHPGPAGAVALALRVAPLITGGLK